MSRYSTGFKLSVIREYMSGEAGFSAIAKRHDLDEGALRRWIAAHRVHGIAGIKKKYTRYRADFKLTVLRHMRDNGLSQRDTAALFDIRNSAAIGIWERRYDEGGLDALSDGRRGRPKKMKKPPIPKSPAPSALEDDQRPRQELLDELKYLRMENVYLKKLKALVQAQEEAAQPKKHK